MSYMRNGLDRQSRSGDSIRNVIAEGYDPGATIKGDSDPKEVFLMICELHADDERTREDPQNLEVTLDDVVEYIREIAECESEIKEEIRVS